MTTHEREITHPVDLATPDGRQLNGDARGWSRRPLHRANLTGRWGRNKRWDYWAVLAGDVVMSLTYADVDYLGIADVWWADLTDGTSGGRSVMVPLARGINLPDVSGTASLQMHRNAMDLSITDDTDGTTHLRAAWTGSDGTPGRMDVSVTLPEGHESLNVVIPWSDRQFQFTSKHQARPAEGNWWLVTGSGPSVAKPDRHGGCSTSAGGDGRTPRVGTGAGVRDWPTTAVWWACNWAGCGPQAPVLPRTACSLMVC